MNLKFKELLDSLNIECELEYRIENRFYDIHIKNTKLLIEIDPTWTHCSKGNIYTKMWINIIIEINQT